MRHPEMRVDNVRAWLDALPDYRPVRGRFVDVDPDGTLRVCLVGAAIDVARRRGEPIELEVTAAGVAFRPRPGTLAPLQVSEWLGLDLLELRVRPQDLPRGLRGRLELVIEVHRARHGGQRELDAECGRDEGGFEVMDLFDRGASLVDLRDALRWTLDIDWHQVAADEVRSVPAPTVVGVVA